MKRKELTVGDISPLTKRAGNSRILFGLAVETLRIEAELSRDEMNKLNREFTIIHNQVRDETNRLFQGKTNNLSALTELTQELDAFVNTIIDTDNIKQ